MIVLTLGRTVLGVIPWSLVRGLFLANVLGVCPAQLHCLFPLVGLRSLLRSLEASLHHPSEKLPSEQFSPPPFA